ncbi:MAG: hypothetical protein ALAOOOJD_01208 [bacterium]|nr:hypothetical protein [bacterium]
MAKKTRTTKPMAVPQKQESDRPNWFAQHPVLTALGIYFLLVMIFFFSTIFGGRTYLSPDAQTHGAVTAPLDKAFWETWTLPQWSPYTFAGIPSFASLMYAPFVYMPGTVLLPLARLVTLPAMFTPALHYVLAAMGVFVFLRRKGASFSPALLGGIAFMFTPYLIVMQVFGHGSQMMTSAYIPWALWAVDRLMEKFSWRNLGLAGLILGFQFQRGHVQISYYILLFVGLYVLCYVVSGIMQKDFKRIAIRLGGFAGALALAGALAAILYLPLQEYTPYSIRGTPSVLQTPTGPQDTGVGFEYATQWSFSPGEMMTFIIPSFYGFGGQTYWGNMPFTDYPNYMGILVLALAVVALLSNLFRQGPHRLLAIFFSLVILFSLLISFGFHFSAFYKLFYHYFPYFNKFRVPVMILILVQCSVAILAGLGLESILSRLRAASTKEEANTRAKMAQRLWIALAAVVVVALALTLFRTGFFNFMRGVYPDQYDPTSQQYIDTARFGMLFQDLWVVSICLVGGLALLALALTRKISPNTAAVAMGLITLVDLWMVDKKIGQTYPQPETPDYLQPDGITEFLKTDSTVFRFYPEGPLFGELRWSAQGFQSVGGYHAAKPRLYQDFIEATGLQGAGGSDFPGHHVLDLLNAKYVITLANLPDSAWIVRREFQVNAGGAPQVLRIYENPTVLPRAYFAGEYEVQTEPVAALKRLRAGPEQGFDPHRRVMLTEAPALTPQPDSTARAHIQKYDFHHIAIATQSAAPQILVLSDNYYPAPAGWQAYVDNQPVKTYRANYCFRAVGVPAGSHLIEFRFHSRAFTLGLWTSLAALVVGIVLVFVERRNSPVS